MTFTSMRCSLILTAGVMALAQTTPDHSESVCIPQHSIWKQGIEFRHVLCTPGVDVEASPVPVPGFAGAKPTRVFGRRSQLLAEPDRNRPCAMAFIVEEKKGMHREDPSLTARQVGISRLQQSFGRSSLFPGQSAMGFVYFKKPKSKDAVIAIVFEPDQGSAITAQIAVSGKPAHLLP